MPHGWAGCLQAAAKVDWTFTVFARGQDHAWFPGSAKKSSKHHERLYELEEGGLMGDLDNQRPD